MSYNIEMDYKDKALSKHRELRGKIEIKLKDNLDSKEKLSTYYTPGVGAVSSYVAEHPLETREYTWLNNSVAVISDGSAVLGLGDIGPQGALPVMEGKCMLFKSFADIDAIPIVLDVHSTDEIVHTVKAIAPSFGAINLEDIAAPKCFEVEEILKNEINIPLMHDDQHGTAVVVLAGLINASKVVGKDIKDMKVVIVGSGAAGVAVAKLIHNYAKPDIVTVDSKGIVSKDRTDLNPQKKELSEFNKRNINGSLLDALNDADVVIGVSQPNLLGEKEIKAMAKNPIVFALANPIPEILPDQAKTFGVAVIATGRSDFPNQVNNALAFPGIFRGALDNNISKITDKHKIDAAKAIADFVSNPTADEIIPSIFEKGIVPAIAKIIC